MSNPSKIVQMFDGSMGVFAPINPERYSDGAWFEQGTTNLVPNPVAATNTSGWATLVGRTLERVTSLPAPLPDWLDGKVATCFRMTAAIDSPGWNIASFNVTLTSDPYVQSWYVYVPADFTSESVSCTITGFTGVSGSGSAPVNLSLRDQWQRVESAVFTPDSGDLSGTMVLTGSFTMQAGQVIYFAAVQVEQGLCSTSFAFNSFGPGYSGSTTHTRAASSASIATANHIDPSSGSIAFRVTPQIETAAEEIWGEAGTKGGGTDHLRWGRDATKHLYMEWSSNNAAYQRITSTETLNALTQYFVYLDWDGTAIRVQVDRALIQSDTRDAVSGSWGAGDLKLQASAGGNVVGPFMTTDRVLMDNEISVLYHQQAWGPKTLGSNRGFTSAFQLRPRV